MDPEPSFIVAVVLRNREVPGKNFGPETGYSEALCGVPHFLWQVLELYITFGHGHFL
jgi:hypothetical protein